MRKILYVFLLLVLTACQNSNNPSEAQSVGTYVYLDGAHTIHVDRKCDKIYRRGSVNGVKFIPKKSLRRNRIKNFCSYCISDSAYEELVKDELKTY